MGFEVSVGTGVSSGASRELSTFDVRATAGVDEKGRAIRAMKALGTVKDGRDGNLGGMVGFCENARRSMGPEGGSVARLKLSRYFFGRPDGMFRPTSAIRPPIRKFVPP